MTVTEQRGRRLELSLNLSEVFGPTIQGEGRHAGQLASFIRLSGCNLSCDWCDTPYTWDWSRFDRSSEAYSLTASELATKLPGLPGRLVVSGGEPLLQARGLARLLLSAPGRAWDVETNGTRPLGPTAGLWSTVTCSPKIGPSAGQWPQGAEIHGSVLDVADFKFVVRDQADLDAVERWLDNTFEVPAERVWLMPEGTSAAVLTERAPWLMGQAVRLGLNYSSRLHVYGWGDSKGH